MQNMRFDVMLSVLSFISAGGVASEALENQNSPKWIFVSITDSHAKRPTKMVVEWRSV
jgi:hypothetical protein